MGQRRGRKQRKNPMELNEKKINYQNIWNTDQATMIGNFTALMNMVEEKYPINKLDSTSWTYSEKIKMTQSSTKKEIIKREEIKKLKVEKQ